MRRILLLLFVAACLATAGCGLFDNFFDTDSNQVDMAESYRAKTGRYPPNF
jgi:hypothetical protein